MKNTRQTLLSSATRAVLLASLLLTATPATAQGQNDASLMGTWVCTDASAKGEKAVVGKDFVILDGERIPFRIVSPGVLAIGSGKEEERATYELRDGILTIKDSSTTTTWSRAGATPPEPFPPQPYPPQPKPIQEHVEPVVNPLDVPAVQDPFSRKFQGDGMSLQLSGDAMTGYRGQLTFRGKTYPVEARSNGNALQGSFRTQGGQSFGFRATLTGENLTLESGSGKYRLVGEKAANPLDPHTDRPSVNRPSIDRPSVDRPSNDPRPFVPADNSKAFVSNAAGVACRIPQGWNKTNESANGCVVFPTAPNGQTPKMSVSLHCLPLDPQFQSMTPEALLQGELPATRKGLMDSGGIQTFEPSQVQRITVNGKPAAFVTMRAETRQKHRGFVWFALRIEGDRCLACNAIFIDGEEANALPMVKRIFESLNRADAQTPATGRDGIITNQFDVDTGSVETGRNADRNFGGSYGRNGTNSWRY